MRHIQFAESTLTTARHHFQSLEDLRADKTSVIARIGSMLYQYTMHNIINQGIHYTGR